MRKYPIGTLERDVWEIAAANDASSIARCDAFLLMGQRADRCLFIDSVPKVEVYLRVRFMLYLVTQPSGLVLDHNNVATHTVNPMTQEARVPRQ